MSSIRKILTEVRDTIEEQVPDHGKACFAFLRKHPAGGADEDIPATAQHRSMVLRRIDGRPLNDLTGAKVNWEIQIMIDLIHDWKREDYFEAEMIRCEDVHRIIETMHFKRPGASLGARLWTYQGDNLSTAGQRWLTSMTFIGQIQLDNHVIDVGC